MDAFSDFYENALTWKASLQQRIKQITAERSNSSQQNNNTTLNDQVERILSHYEQSLTGIATTPTNPNASFNFQPQANNRTTVKLPKIELTKYNGDILKWKEFIDMFNATIHNNTSLTQVEKLNYLLSQLTGEAKTVLTGLDVTNENYDVARKLLEDRFGNPQIAITSLHTKLMKIPTVYNNTSSLQSMYNEVEGCRRSLSALGQNVDNDHFVSLIMLKLPYAFITNLERSKAVDTPWTVQLLCKGIRTEINAMESAERVRQSQNTAQTQQQRSNEPHSFRKWQPRASSQNSQRANYPNFTTQQRRSNGDTMVASETGGKGFSRKCIFCSGNHWDDECKKFKTVEARKNIIKGRCYICLSPNHRQPDCKVQKACPYCKKVGRHHRSLCFDQFSEKSTKSDATAIAFDGQGPSTNTDSKEDPENPIPVSSIQGQTLLAAGDQVQLQTAVVTIQNKALPIKIQSRGLLDTASTRSYITENVANQIKTKPTSGETVIVNRFASGKKKKIPTKRINIQLLLRDGTSLEMTVNVVPHITGKLYRAPLKGNITSNFLWKQLPLADKWPSSEEQVEIELLIGMDHYLDIVSMEKIKLWDGMYLLGSRLGWLLSGRCEDTRKGTQKDHEEYTMMVVSYTDSNIPHQLPEIQVDQTFRDAVTPSLEDMFELDRIGITDCPIEHDDDKALELFNKTVKLQDNRYMVTWPWKNPYMELPDNFALSKGRLQSLIKKLKVNPELMEKYNTIIADQLQKGVVEKVSPETKDSSRIYYLPHHAIITPQKTTTKVRIVYDASAKSRPSQSSLNDCLFRGPTFLQNLCGLLLRFLIYEIVLLSDIEKAFLQVGLQLPDREVTRFLWLKDINNPCLDYNLQLYRFCRVPFGIVSSPFLLGASNDYHLKESGSLRCEEMRKNVYVDNILMGSNSIQESLSIYKEAKEIFAKASMNLREWTSNNQEFLQQIPEVDRVVQEETKVLGIKWNSKTDVISIQGASTQQLSSVKTLRDVVKVIGTFFDPLGHFLAVTVRGKLFIRELGDKGLTWDDALKEDDQKSWEMLSVEFSKITTISVPRMLLPKKKGSETLSIICFSDASAKLFAALVYLQARSNESFHTRLMFAKCRLAPKKTVSIPRLESMSILIGVRAIKFCETELRLPIKQKILLSDSKCALYWLKSQKPLPKFVENRVTEVKSHSEIMFRYVRSEEKPADWATRGKDIEDLSSFWFNGPSWINNDLKDWPSDDINELNPQCAENIANCSNKAQVMLTAENQSSILSPFDIDITIYSSLTKVYRITAYANRFISRCKGNVRDDERITGKEIITAKQQWERYSQRKCFPQVFDAIKQGKKNQLVDQLAIKIDPDGLMRCQTRMSNANIEDFAKTPMLLNRHDDFTKLVIKNTHKRLFHAGAPHTLFQIRYEYWIPQGRKAVQEIIHNCQLCRRHQGGPFRLPVMAELPSSRVNPSPPFTYTGLDYFGPLYIKTTNIEKQKVWVCLFCCLAVRAVHLEVVLDMSSEQFLLCMRRFIAKRGKPSQINCDNAPQFKAVKNTMDKAWKTAITHEQIKDFASTEGIKWNFITKMAPWQGGYYERLVGVVKKCLRKALGKLCLNLVQLQTILAETERIVNSRPLCYVENDISAGITLTPNDFLCLNPKTAISSYDEEIDPDYTENSKQNTLLEIWKKGEAHLSTFWKCWVDEYLLSLRGYIATEHKSSFIFTNWPVVPETVVLIKNQLLPRGSWQIGKIEKIVSSSDNLVRSAVAKLPNGKQLRRPINHLFPIGCHQIKDIKESPQKSSSPQSQERNIARPKRDSAIKALRKIQDCLSNEPSK